MESNELPRDLIPLAEAAARLGVSKDTVRRMIKRGDIPGYRVGLRMIRVSAADVRRAARPMGGDPS